MHSFASDLIVNPNDPSNPSDMSEELLHIVLDFFIALMMRKGSSL